MAGTTMTAQWSRRALMGWGVLGLLTVAWPWRAAAQEKIAPNLVQYQQKPKGTQECDGCLHFVAPNQCKVVSGTINPKGWCALFAAKPK
jgi:hypothetical protein